MQLLDVLDLVAHDLDLVLDGDHSELICLELAAESFHRLKGLLHRGDLFGLLQIDFGAWYRLFDSFQLPAELDVAIEIPLNLLLELLCLLLDLLHLLLIGG